MSCGLQAVGMMVVLLGVCGTESQVKYQTVAECKADIEYSTDLLRLRIRQEFGDQPEQVIINPSCGTELIWGGVIND